MRLIDADALLEELPVHPANGMRSVREEVLMIRVRQTIVEAPTVEQPETVRCKDCKWYQAGIDIDGKPFTRCNGDVRVYGHTTPDWFCAYGEVKQDD